MIESSYLRPSFSWRPVLVAVAALFLDALEGVGPLDDEISESLDRGTLLTVN